MRTSMFSVKPSMHLLVWLILVVTNFSYLYCLVESLMGVECLQFSLLFDSVGWSWYLLRSICVQGGRAIDGEGLVSSDGVAVPSVMV